MSHREGTGRSDDDSRGDPAFRLTPAYRRRLSAVSQDQYEAAGQSNRRQADRLRSRLVDGPPLGRGVGRLVYRLPDRAYADGSYGEYVLKLPVPDHHDRYGYDRDGRVQNRTERGLWERQPSGYLVPVVAADQHGRWLIMPRGESPEQAPDRLEEFAARVADTYDLSGAQGRDIATENVVTLDEQLRLCDYGMLM